MIGWSNIPTPLPSKGTVVMNGLGPSAFGLRCDHVELIDAEGQLWSFADPRPSARHEVFFPQHLSDACVHGRIGHRGQLAAHAELTQVEIDRGSLLGVPNPVAAGIQSRKVDGRAVDQKPHGDRVRVPRPSPAGRDLRRFAIIDRGKCGPFSYTAKGPEKVKAGR